MNCLCSDFVNFVLTIGLLQLVSCQVFNIMSVQFNQCTQLRITARVNPPGSNFTFNWVARPSDRDLPLSSLVYNSNGQVSAQKTSNSFLSQENFDVTNNLVQNTEPKSFDSILEVRNLPKNQTVEFAITSGSTTEVRERVTTPSCTFPKDVHCNENCLTSTPCNSSFTKVCLDGKSVVQQCPANVSTAQRSPCNEVAIVCSVSMMKNDHLAPVDRTIESVGLGEVLPFECMDGYTGNQAEYNCSTRNLFTPMNRKADCSPFSSRNIIYGLIIGLIAVIIISGILVVCQVGKDTVLDVYRAVFEKKKKDKKETDEKISDQKNLNIV